MHFKNHAICAGSVLQRLQERPTGKLIRDVFMDVDVERVKSIYNSTQPGEQNACPCG